MRLIDLDDGKHVFCGSDGEYEKWNIDPTAPTIEERKTGEWIETETVWTAVVGDTSFEIPSRICSVCKKPIAKIMWDNFCPNCGAKMEGEDDG